MNLPVERASLAEWRRTISETYAAIRRASDEKQFEAWLSWRQCRNLLFKTHEQSPLDVSVRDAFTGLQYFDYDLAWRVSGSLEADMSGQTFTIQLTEDGVFRCSRVATTEFVVAGNEHRLGVFWIEGYGGGLFLPFRDLTNGRETFGGGRYLYDTIKGADLGVSATEIILDFNYAYNPSCAYHERWVCPLPPPENFLPIVVTAGELDFKPNSHRTL